ncbi:hypothetical protein LZ554_004795 [Drepanopeziza brunnea f. sp. 'monogermtubi']|nr:hypothetical protein LZ554_004795 [Drepanopeziza brunnea f. sp. 'monogermtubi']
MFLLFRSLAVIVAFGSSIASSQNSEVNRLVSRRLTEYLLPATPETHEFARVPETDFVLLSQMSDSQLIKIQLDPTTEAPIAFQSFPMGINSKSGLHGVFPSKLYPGRWLSLQYENKLLLVNPGSNLSAVPSIITIIDILEPGNGPHCVFEIGSRVWAGLKVASLQDGNYYVFSADISDLTTTDRNQNLYQCLKSPVFIQEEPTTKLIYATQDTSSSIMRINVTSGETIQLPIPPEMGNTPVGMITAYGPMNGIWFSLAGNSAGGSGSFGRIDSDGKLQFF